MRTVGSSLNTSAVGESTRRSTVDNISKANPYKDSGGKFTSKGKAVAPKSKGKKPSVSGAKRNKQNETEQQEAAVDARTDAVVNALAKKAGKEIAEQWKPKIRAALAIQMNPSASSKELDAPLKLGKQTFLVGPEKKPLTAKMVLDLMMDEVGVSTVTGVSEADFVSGDAFRRSIGKSSEVSKRNPYHDSRGRFTSSSRAITVSGGRSKGRTRSSNVRTVKPAPRQKRKKGAPRQKNYKTRIEEIDAKIDALLEQRPLLFGSGGQVMGVSRAAKPRNQDKDLARSEKQFQADLRAGKFKTAAEAARARAQMLPQGRVKTAVRSATDSSAQRFERQKREYSRKLAALQEKRVKVLGDAARAKQKRDKKEADRAARGEKYLKRKPSAKRKRDMQAFSERLRQSMNRNPSSFFEQQARVRRAQQTPELVFRQPPKPKKSGKRRRGWVGKLSGGVLQSAVVYPLAKNSPTVSDVHLPTIMGNRKRKKRVKKIDVAEIVAKKEKLKDPKGGLTAAGRRHFNRTTGSNLKPGVKGKADTPEKMRRKGSFLTRFFTNPSGPMKDDKGRPTRLALSAAAWGEPVPKDRASAARLAQKGRNLLDRYENAKKSKVSKRNPYHDQRGRFTTGSRAITVSGGRSKSTGQPGTSGARAKAAAKKRKDFDMVVGRSEQLRSRITPTNKREQQKAQQVQDYMMPAVKRFKNPSHRAYSVARVKQMTSGKARPKGMSKKYRMSADDVRRYEAVLGSIFKSGRIKYGI